MICNGSTISHSAGQNRQQAYSSAIDTIALHHPSPALFLPHANPGQSRCEPVEPCCARRALLTKMTISLHMLYFRVVYWRLWLVAVVLACGEPINENLDCGKSRNRICFHSQYDLQPFQRRYNCSGCSTRHSACRRKSTVSISQGNCCVRLLTSDKVCQHQLIVFRPRLHRSSCYFFNLLLILLVF